MKSFEKIIGEFARALDSEFNNLEVRVSTDLPSAKTLSNVQRNIIKFLVEKFDGGGCLAPQLGSLPLHPKFHIANMKISSVMQAVGIPFSHKSYGGYDDIEIEYFLQELSDLSREQMTLKRFVETKDGNKCIRSNMPVLSVAVSIDVQQPYENQLHLIFDLEALSDIYDLVSESPEAVKEALSGD